MKRNLLFNLSLLLFLGFFIQPIFSQLPEKDTLLIDFGNNLSSAPWNNIESVGAGFIENLPKSDGFLSGYGIQIFDAFNGINTNGTINPNPDLDIPSTASGDSFFGNGLEWNGQIHPTGGVELFNLKTDKAYTLSIFASRIASDNRETQYLIEGLTTEILFLNVASNIDSVVTATMMPDANGVIRVTASPGPNNNNTFNFYYLGAMKVIFDHEEPSSDRALSLLEPNGGEFWQVGAMPTIFWDSKNVLEVILDYSTDNGQSWTNISTVNALEKKYTWIIPNTPTTEALVRITSDTLSDVSDAAFEISDMELECRIVVLGSSTAAGTGVSNSDSSWVNRYARYLQYNTQFPVTNLAQGGYNTYRILPTGTTIPAGVGVTIDESRNVTQALSLNPFAIIVNMPSNDAAANYPVADQMANFDLIIADAASQGVPVWIATTQPRNFSNQTQIDIQTEVRDSILNRYGNKAIDFWTGIADVNGFILPEYDSGDGVHLNDAGHQILYNRIIAAGIDMEGCSIINAVTDLPKTQINNVKVYPNPNDGNMNFEFETVNGGEVEIKIIDQLGRTLEQKKRTLSQSGKQIINWNSSLGNATKIQLFFAIISFTDQRGVTKKVVPILIQE